MDKYFAFKVDKSRHSEMVIESNNRWKSWIFGCVQSRADDSWYVNLYYNQYCIVLAFKIFYELSDCLISRYVATRSFCIEIYHNIGV